jgi:hypothetical protein
MIERKRTFLIFGLSILTLLFLNSCSVDIYGNTLEDGYVVFTPVVWLANWFWIDFTPKFWAWIVSSFSVPSIGWLLGVFACILGALEYLLDVAIWAVVILIIIFLCSIVWLLVGIWIGRVG